MIIKRQELLVDFTAHLKNNRLSALTIKNYTADINTVLKSFEEGEEFVDLKNLNFDNYKIWLLSLREKISNRSVNRHLCALKKFIQYIKYKFNYQDQLSVKLKSLKITKTLPKVISHETILKIREYLLSRKNKKKWQNLRDCCLLDMLYATGLRISEALVIKFQDILDQDYLVVKGKGNKDRVVPILDVLQKSIARLKTEYPFKVENNNAIFLIKANKSVSIRYCQDLLQHIRINMNLDDFLTPHKIRHSFATALLNNGVNILEIQQLLGHSSTSTTQIYTKVDTKNLATKLNKLQK